jgi:WhiB family transcriptional regulator, redox-sensing transcriptional regulator
MHNWKPAKSMEWQKGAECAKPSNREKLEYFFSKDPSEKYEAKNMCFVCPVRKECMQWALEHRMVYGIWGGKDEIDIRRALSVTYLGEETRRRRFPNCPHCSARPSKLETEIVDLPKGGRWTTARIVYCTECDFSWRSRTSVNAVNAYKALRAEKFKEKFKTSEE